jgi:hypothetical protein
VLREIFLWKNQRVLNDIQRIGLSRQRMKLLLPHTLRPPLSRQPVVSLSLYSCVSLVELTDGRGGGESQKIRHRKSQVVLYESLILFGKKRIPPLNGEGGDEKEEGAEEPAAEGGQVALRPLHHRVIPRQPRLQDAPPLHTGHCRLCVGGGGHPKCTLE